MKGVYPRTPRTHCARGHEWTPENTRLRADGRGRECRACAREYRRRLYERDFRSPWRDESFTR